jgi:urease accessory protein
MIARLALAQWLSPAFPTGAFACSHGLEAAIAGGGVAGAAAVEGWIADVLAHGAGWSDAVILARALRPGADLAALDDLARSLCVTAERRAETVDLGAAFARAVAASTGRALPPRAWPVAVAEAAAPLDLPGEEVVALALQAFAGMLVSVAVRFVPLGQSEGQAMLARLHPAIAALAARAVRAGPDDPVTAALGADMAALVHETLPVRIYRT